MEDDVNDIAQVEDGRTAGSHFYHKGDGYFYNCREKRGQRMRLKCRFRNRGCLGTGSLNRTTGILKHLEPHNHPRDPLLPEDLAVRRQLIEEARRDVYGRGTRSILDGFKLQCDNPELASRFTTARMHSKLYEARASNYPPIPNSLTHLGVLLGLPNMNAVCRTVDGRDLIFRGFVGNPMEKTVSVVFISGRMLNFLQTCDNLHGDGTFKKRPRKPKCGQIYNISTNYNGTVVCIMRALMMRRTEVAYVELFTYLRGLAPGMNPSRFHCDFELAQMNAIKRIFPPPCVVYGCLWHYSVAVGGQSRKLGLAVLAKENELFHSYLRCLGAIPLLPMHQMWQGALEIWIEVEAAGWAAILGPVFAYLQEEWYPRTEELCVHGAEERTNNVSESDNRMLANAVPQNHPNVWRLIAGFVQTEYLAWLDKMAVYEAIVGTDRPRRWKTIANDVRVRRSEDLLEAGIITPGEFLKRASWAVLGGLNHGLRLDRAAVSSDSESESGSDSESSSDTESGSESE